ncbi:MAG: Ldh family oxidoreductase [Clostridia bacterium]|nr:Ldh family oxidoreductase [Clostridia bacterium]
MGYVYLDYPELRGFCQSVFCGYGFTEQESGEIADVILAADLNGIESHGVQRMVRYAYEIRSGMVDVHAKPEVVHETPISAVMDAHNAMGQLVGRQAMRLAIEKAKHSGCGMVVVRCSNHYGIAGYYTEMAREVDLLGICMTNTEEIMVPTHGKTPMIGTNPIALSMPADPIPFLFDCATTVVPRGKFEVYAKRGDPVPVGWGVDERGLDSDDASRVLENIIGKAGGGILPLGGSTEMTGGHKGYGLGVIVELFTGILSGGTTADRIYRTGSGSGICQSFIAIDYGLFGNRTEIRASFSEYLDRIRNSPKAEGCTRIYTHGEKEAECRKIRRTTGIPVNEKTLQELRNIAEELGCTASFPHTVRGPVHPSDISGQG